MRRITHHKAVHRARHQHHVSHQKGKPHPHKGVHEHHRSRKRK